MADLDSAGLHAVAHQLSDANPVLEPPLPTLTRSIPVLLQDFEFLVRPTPPTQIFRKDLIRKLKAYLDEDGMQLFAGMSHYPQLHWGFTRALDASLFGASKTVESDTDRAAHQHSQRRSEIRLLKVARLPWCRAGWIPDWLRTDLIRAVRRDWPSIRKTCQQLLLKVTLREKEGVTLPVDLPEQSGFWPGVFRGLEDRIKPLHSWLHRLAGSTAPQPRSEEHVFVRVRSWLRRAWEFVAPRRLFGDRLKGALGKILAPWLLVFLIAIVIAVVYHLMSTEARNGDTQSGDAIPPPPRNAADKPGGEAPTRKLNPPPADKITPPTIINSTPTPQYQLDEILARPSDPRKVGLDPTLVPVIRMDKPLDPSQVSKIPK